MDYPKSVPGVGLVDGKFIDENTTTGQVGSLIPCAWGNAVTDELLNVIRAGGDEPVEGEHDQLVAAIRAIVRDAIPEEEIRTTLADYGITDAYTKATTYTKAEVEALLAALDIATLSANVQALKKIAVSGHTGLVVSATGTNALIAIKARRLIVGNGAIAQALSNVDVGINLSTVGLGGLDAGILSASSWYSAWVATDGAQAVGIAALMPAISCTTTAGSAVVTGIASTASMRAGMQFGGPNFPPGAFIKSVDSPSQITASVPALAAGAGVSLRFVYEPVLPVGYVAKRVNAFFTDATANKYPLSFVQTGCLVQYKLSAGTNVPAAPLMATGVMARYTPISSVNFVPPTAARITGTLYNIGNYEVAVTPNGVGITAMASVYQPGGNGAFVSQFNMLLESPNIYGYIQATTGTISCTGWEDTL